MSFSLNETEALIKRAARGAGLPWGLAQEAAFAGRWLAACDLDGPWLLAGLLEQNTDIPLSNLTPETDGLDWHGPGDHLCPLICGTALSDAASHWQGRHNWADIVITGVSHPLLMLPFVASLALRANMTFSLEWEGVRVASDGNKVSVSGPKDAVNTFARVRVTCRATSQVGTALSELVKPALRAQLTEKCYQQLSHLAWLTLAPATQQSRDQGAGAGSGLKDND